MDIFTTGSSSRSKVAVIGSGYVGASIAYALTVRGIVCDIALIDIDRSKAHGEAEDIQHGIPFMGDCSVRAGDYSDCADCDLIIITAGRNRRVGETRLKLIDDNRAIMYEVIENIKPHYTKGVVLIVSNPVDLMVHLCNQWLDLPPGRVFGTGCLLDTSRLVRAVSDYVGLSPNTVNGFIVGEHGDSQVPVWSRFTVGGIDISEYCSSVGLVWDEARRAQIAANVKGMGADIIAAKGRTHFGIATCVCYLADAILNNRSTIASVSSPLNGEYGVHDVSLSVPSIIGPSGVEKKIVETWSDAELAAFLQSAEKLKQTLEHIKV